MPSVEESDPEGSGREGGGDSRGHLQQGSAQQKKEAVGQASQVGLSPPSPSAESAGEAGRLARFPSRRDCQGNDSRLAESKGRPEELEQVQRKGAHAFACRGRQEHLEMCF